MENGNQVQREDDILDSDQPVQIEEFSPPTIITSKYKPELQHDVILTMTNEIAPTDLKFEIGMYILGEYGELLDLVNDNVKRSFADKKSTSKIASVIYSSQAINASLQYDFKIAFHLLPETSKFVFLTVRSSGLISSFSKGEPHIHCQMSTPDKPLWKYTQPIIGEHTSLIVGFFDCIEREKDETTWEYHRLNTKTNFETIQEAISKFHHELLHRSLVEKKELMESYSKPYKYFKIRRGHELPIKNKQLKISFDSILLGEEFDIDLTVLFYNENGHLINYCFGDIDEPFGSEKKILSTASSHSEPTKSQFWVDLTKLDRIEYKRKKDEVSITTVKSMVFALTIYEPNSFNFLWVSETKVRVCDGSSDRGDEVFTMTCQQSFLTSVILCMLYKDDSGKWCFRAIDEAKRANHFVDLLDGIRQEYIPRKPIVGVQELAVGGNLDKMDIDQDQLLNVKIRHNSYKKEHIDRLNLIVYDNRGFVVKFIDQIPTEKDPYGCLDHWIRFDMTPFIQNRDEGWTIVGVLTGEFPAGTDLVLELHDMEKKKVHFQMALETQLYLETDTEDETHCYSCIPFQMVQKPKEGGVKLWTIKAEGICTSQNKPVQWFPFIKNHILRDLIGRRNHGNFVQKKVEHKIDSLDHLTIGVQTKEGKVMVALTPFDYTLREYTQDIVGDGYAPKYKYSETGPKGTTERDLITMYRQNDYYWYDTDKVKYQTTLPIPGEGDQCQIVIDKLDKTCPFRMFQFGIYLQTERKDLDRREDIVIKIYGGTKPEENEILFTTTIRLSGDRTDPLEKEIFQHLKTATSANVFVPFVITRNNFHPETGEYVNGEKDWSIAFIYGRHSNVKKHLENSDMTLEPCIPRQALKLVVETIGARGLFGGDPDDKSDSFCQGTIAGVTFTTSTRAQTCDPDWKETSSVPILKEDWNKATLKMACFESKTTKDGKKTSDPIPLGEFEIPSLALIPQAPGQNYAFTLLAGESKGKRPVTGTVLLNFKYNRDESVNINQ